MTRIIIDTYERIEMLHGGLAVADLGRVFEQTMAELRLINPEITEREVRKPSDGIEGQEPRQSPPAPHCSDHAPQRH